MDCLLWKMKNTHLTNSRDESDVCTHSFHENVCRRVYGQRGRLRVRALAWDIVLCSWERQLTFTVSLFTPVRCINGYRRMWQVILLQISRGSRITLSRFMVLKPRCSLVGHLARMQIFFYINIFEPSSYLPRPVCSLSISPSNDSRQLCGNTTTSRRD